MVFCGEEWWHSVTLAYNTTHSFTISLFTIQSWKRSFANLLLLLLSRRTLCLRAHGIRKSSLSFLIWSLCSVFLHISSPRRTLDPVSCLQIKTAGFVFLCERRLLVVPHLSRAVMMNSRQNVMFRDDANFIHSKRQVYTVYHCPL